jgi:hypothetical protein
MFRPFLGHHKALQENQTKFLNCVNIMICCHYYHSDPPFDECSLVVNARNL